MRMTDIHYPGSQGVYSTDIDSYDKSPSAIRERSYTQTSPDMHRGNDQ